MRMWLCVVAGGVVAGMVGQPRAGAQDAASPPVRDPSIYRHVSSLGWIVRDLDAVVSAWRRFGVTDVSEPAEIELTIDYGGRRTPARVRRSTARFPNARIEWIQPLGGENAFTAFLQSHGDGVHHLAFRVPTKAKLDEEVASYTSAGVDVVQRSTRDTPAGAVHAAYLDTATEGGGIALALESGPGPDVPGARNEPPFGDVTQYAFLVRDVQRVSRFHQRLGFGALDVDRNVSLDRMYRGRPAGFEMFLGWGRWADIVFEWIEPIVGPSVYEEHAKRHGEGFHHLGFHVPDMDAAVAALQARGLQVTMSGGWDSDGHQGRFAYLDTERYGGVALELLWNKPRN